MAENRKRTNAEIDHLNQFVKEGEQKLPYEMEDKNNDVELTEEQKIEAQKKEQEEKDAAKEQEKINKEIEANKDKIIAGDKSTTFTTTTTQTNITEPELDDEKVLAYLKNKKGKELSSLEDLLNPKKELTPEEKQKQDDEREAHKFSYGLTNGLFSKKELENYIADTRNITETVYDSYAAKQKELEPELTDEAIREEFESEFGLDETDKESRRYKKGQLILNNLAANIINQKYPNILNLEKMFSDYEKSTSQEKEAENRIVTKSPIYLKDMEEVKNEMKKVSFTIDKNDVFETELPDEAVQSVVSRMLSKDHIKKQVNKGWTKAELLQAAQTTAIIETLPFLLKRYADAKVLENQKGIRGIVAPDERRKRVLETAELNEDQKTALSYYQGKLVNN